MKYTVKHALEEGKAAILSGGYSETPYLDVLLLLGYAAGTGKEELLSYPNKELSSAEYEQYSSLIRKRASGRPTAYLIGKKEFFGREFLVNPSVLIPRPDTEVLVEWALEKCRDLQSEQESAQNSGEKQEPVSVLDLCTGTGCIGLSLQAETEKEAGTNSAEISVTCSDIDPEALDICRKNAAQLGIHPEAIVQSDLFEHISRKFKLIITNPPYLTEDEMKDRLLTARKEPEKALYGGRDGLYFIEIIIDKGFTHLHENGYLCIESGSAQTAYIAEQMGKMGFSDIGIIRDLSGMERGVFGQRRS
ncbi:MAG: peptide chain release factor N(5)-glutamine methyltransferase [Spirochaetales bacterium]|nr:peptide chain release factor N(5)-glutamine methyltransferase [Spirochaetales bacterium]